MSMEWRGGQPTVIRVSTSTTMQNIAVPGRTTPREQGTAVTGFVPTGITKWVRLRNLSSTNGENIHIYFDPSDAQNADANRYLTLLPGDIVREPMELNQIWVVAATGTPVLEFTCLARRG